MFRLPDSWLWDFWLTKDEQTYHLFFLYASRALHDPDRRHLRAGVGHAVSTDLLHWAKDERNPLVSADPRWYETIGGDDPWRDEHWRDEHWRDPWVFADPDGDGWHMLITGRANTGPLDGRGVVAHARSADLAHWEVRPPLSGPDGGFGQLEVFQVENIDGRWVLVFNCVDQEFAAARATQGGPGGVWVAGAASALGPYDIAGATLLSDDRYYVGKLVRDPDGRWVFLAFINKDENGDFVGDLTDPIPVGWDGDRLVLQPTG